LHPGLGTKKSLANPIARLFNPNVMKTNIYSDTDAGNLFNLEFCLSTPRQVVRQAEVQRPGLGATPLS
jgi:hypothetical protein